MKRGIFYKLLFFAVVITFLVQSTMVFAAVLNVPEKFQEQNQWCWAGASQAILEYYGTEVTQTQIAAYGTNGYNTWNYLYGSDAVAPYYRKGINMILYNWGLTCTYGYYTMSQIEVQNQINAGRPFVIRWGWYSGGGHFVDGRGIEGDYVYYMDPWPGDGYKIALYSWVVDDGIHQWTHSLELTTGPPANSAPVLAAIGPRSVNRGENLAVGLSAVDADADDTLTFMASGLPGFCALTDYGDRSGVIDCSPGCADMGSYPITVTVTDDGFPNLSDEETFTLTVNGMNRAPVADPGGPYFAVVDDDLLLDASQSYDPDENCGDTIQSYEWDIDDDGVFGDVVGQTALLNWSEIEQYVCGGLCDMETTYSIGLKVTDVSALDNSAYTTFTMSYRLYFDDFSDGVTQGDPDWEEITGNWLVNQYERFVSSVKLNNRALVQGDEDPSPVSTGSFRTKVKLTRTFKRKANAALIFAYQDESNYRYVRLVKRDGPGKVLIGQVGDPAGVGDDTGVRAVKKKKIIFGKWYRLYVDVYDSGLVNVYINNTDEVFLSYDFGNTVSGRTGYQAVKAKSLFDNFSVWDEMILP